MNDFRRGMGGNGFSVNQPGGLMPGQPERLTPTDPIFMVQDEPRGPSQLIEVNVPVVGTTKQLLPVIQNLQNQVDVNVVLKVLRVIPDTVLPLAPTLGGINAPLTELQKMCLVIYSEEWEKGQLIPLCTLIDTFTEGSGIPWRTRSSRFDSWRNVNWGKSFLFYSNGSSSVGNPYNVIFEAEYQKFGRNGQEIMGPA